MLTVCNLETINTYRRFGRICGINLMLQTTRRHTLKESYGRVHCRENLRSDVTGCLCGQLLNYLQGRSKMSAVVSRGGSTVTSAQVNGDRWHRHQLNMQSSLHLATPYNCFHIHTQRIFVQKNLSSVKPAQCLPSLDLLFSKFCNQQLLPVKMRAFCSLGTFGLPR
jgi:hypothetical protein